MAEQKVITFVSPEKLGYYDGKMKSHIASADEAIRAALQANIDAANKAIADEETRAKAAELTNAQAAAAAQKSADDLAAYVGEFTASEGVDTVVKYIDAKTANIASDETVSALEERVGEAEQAITDLEGVVAGNKTAIEGTVSTLEEKVDANESDIEGKMTALTARVEANETAVGTTLPNAISAEKTRAEEAEAGLEGRIETMEAFWEAAKADEEGKNVIDTLKEIQDYIAGDETGASEMLASINKNKEDIANHVAVDHNFAAADATLKSELEGKINLKADSSVVEAMDAAYKLADQGLSDRIADLEEIDHEAYVTADATLKSELEGKINAKADTSALEEVSGKVTALENANKEGGAVATAIASAQAKADQAQKEVDELEGVVATKAAQADLEAATGRVTTAEGKITTLEGKMSSAEAAIALKADASTVSAMDTAYKAADTAIQGRLDALEAVTHTEITTDFIDQLFQ